MTTNSSDLIVSADLSEFFRDEVCGARDALNIQLSELTEYYLVNLLVEFSRQSTAVPAPGGEPLALIYKRALEADVATRVQLLKNLGDVALYVSSFFADYVERSLVDLDYYISMGGNAYGSLSDLVGSQSRGENFAEVYLHLGERFTEVVDLLTQVAERSRVTASQDTDLLKLYDRWARTKSDRIHKLLVEKGLLPAAGIPTEYLQ